MRTTPDSALSINDAAEAVGSATRIVVLSGAGISTGSGIPDFRGPKGVWTKNPEAEKLATIDNYVSDLDVRKRAWQKRLESPTWSATPNAAHRALVKLEHRGVLDMLITQNIDGLHQEAGSSPEKVVEIHGTIRDVVCLSCGWRDETGPTLERIKHGDSDPRCEKCGGILKSATISFGQSLVQSDLMRSFEAAENADLLLAIGSTLAVYPIAEVVPLAAKQGATIVIVNGEPTQMDARADVVVRDDIVEAVPTICGI